MRIGVDLGGSKIEIIALDAADNTLLRQRLPTPTGDYHETLSTIKQLITASEQQLGQQGSIGIGIPGSPSPATELIRNANSTCLNERPLLQDIRHLLQRKVRIANDANCFTLSEATDGAAAGAASVFGIILVLRQSYNLGCSAPVVFRSKAQHAGNGQLPCQVL